MLERLPHEFRHRTKPNVVRMHKLIHNGFERLDSSFGSCEDQHLKRAIRKELPISSGFRKSHVILKLLPEYNRIFGSTVYFDETRAALVLNPTIGDVAQIDRLLPKLIFPLN